MSESELNQIQIDARNEVLRKVGRNVYLFQQVEKLLKHLNTSREISGYMSELEEKRKIRADEIGKLNMGPLVGQLMDNIYSEFDESRSGPENLKEPYFTFTFKIQTDADFVERRRLALKSLVDERNHLIHHFFNEFDINAIERHIEIEMYLDEQRERIIAEHEQLSFLAKTLADTAQEYVEHLNSDEGVRQFELVHFQQSNLVKILIEVTLSQARQDGWTLLNLAGNELRKHIPEEMNDIKRLYGYKSLKAAVIASELFELTEEETKQGGKRLLYRTKPHVFSEYLDQNPKSTR